MSAIRLSTAEQHRSTVSPAPLSPPTSPPPSHAFHRTSVSIQDDEDPFSPFPTTSDPKQQQEEDDDDEWMRVSEDSLGELGEGEGERRDFGGEPIRTIRKSPSFLKTIWDKRLSRSSSVSSFHSLKSKISNPILKTEPPRVGPLRSRASLVSVGGASLPVVDQEPVTEEEEEEEYYKERQENETIRNRPQPDRLSPPQSSLYPSGSRSVRIKPSVERSSILPPSNLSQTIGPASSRPRTSRKLVRSRSFDVAERPPTDSPKALALLLGTGAMEKNRKERVQGFRSSFIEAEQKLGIALTTDAPTRYVVPDNRLSISSTIDTPSLTSSATDRSTLYSSTTSSFLRPLPRTSEEQFVSTREDSATLPELESTRRQPTGFTHNPSSPLPAPTGPLPPLPDEARRRRTVSAVRFGGGVKQSSDSRSRSTPLFSPLSSRSSEPNLRRPLSDLFSRKLRPVSTDNFGSLRRFRSHEALQPVSSTTAFLKQAKISARQPRPVASLYLVAGLDRDPSKWSFATSDLVKGGSGTNTGSRYSDMRTWRPGVLDIRQPRAEEVVKLSKEEVSQVQAQAIKLAFPEDIKVSSSRAQPPATTSFFSFPITASAFPSSVLSTPSISATSSPSIDRAVQIDTTLYAIALTIWSRADAKRSQAIESSLSEATPRGERDGVEGADDSDERQAEPRSSTIFWLPYSLILVSTSPIYSLLNDALRLSWARHCHDMPLHLQQMQQVLDIPLPRIGGKVEIPFNVSNAQTSFVASVPGDLYWSTPNFPTWPFFAALHSDNILTIAELALAPLGRILFVSQHSIMLGIATFTLQLILQKRGWNGLVRSVTHVRDVHIYLEDPGPWILAVPSSIALNDLSPEVVVVNLDANVIDCRSPSLSAVSTGAVREKARRRLETAIGNVGNSHSIPASIVQAFLRGKFKPFSEVEVDGKRVLADRLVPDPASWDWNEELILSELDAILTEIPKRGALNRFVGGRKNRKLAHLDASTIRVQKIIRKHADEFVARRDALELRLSKMDHKAAALVSESTTWRDSCHAFKEFSEKLTSELHALENRLEEERQEASRLSRIIEEEREYQYELENGLGAMEQSRERAISQLVSTEQARRTLEDQCSIICGEMRAILGSEDPANPLFRAVLESVESLSNASQSSKSSPTSYRRSSSSLESVAEEDPSDEERLEALKLGVKETFAVISNRLSIALDHARQLESPRQEEQSLNFEYSPTIDVSYPSPTSPVSPEEDSTIVQAQFPLDDNLAPRSTSSLSFQPKPLTLTPPISPENGRSSPFHPFVTPRTTHRRTVSKQHSLPHSHQSSVVDNSSPSHSHTTSTLTNSEYLHNHSQTSLPSTEESDYDDAKSFISFDETFEREEEEGRGGERSTFYYDWQDEGSSPTNGESSPSIGSEVEELTAESEITLRQAQLLSPSPSSPSPLPPPPPRHIQHARQDSFGLDAPPVQLFTRSSGSIRRKDNRGRQGSIDLGARMRPSQVKAEGKWEPAPTKVLESMSK